MEWAYFCKVKQSIITKIKAISFWINIVITDIQCREGYSLDQLKCIACFPCASKTTNNTEVYNRVSLTLVLIRYVCPSWLTNTVISYQMTIPKGKQFFGKQHILHAERMQFRWQKWCMLSPVVNDLSIGDPILGFYPYNIASNRFHLFRNFMLLTLNSLWPFTF